MPYLDAVRDVVEDLAQAVIQGGEAVTPSTFLFGCLTLLGCGVLLGELLGLRDVCEHGRDESALSHAGSLKMWWSAFCLGNASVTASDSENAEA